MRAEVLIQSKSKKQNEHEHIQYMKKTHNTETTDKTRLEQTWNNH